MSANNAVLIKREKDKYTISDVCVETGEGFAISVEKTLEDAVNKAQDYCSENIVEYGINFDI